jgi:lysophospholipase L1-like esterase
MQQILVYADSLAWGIVPLTRNRLPFDSRWPGVMENRLNAGARNVRVIEDCLNGRRTVWEDPFKPGRNGLQGLAQRIEIHSPLALVILALGTNDFQSMHPHNAWHSAQGIARLVAAIREAPIEPGMPVPPVLIVACPHSEAPRPDRAQVRRRRGEVRQAGRSLSGNGDGARVRLLRRRRRDVLERRGRRAPRRRPASQARRGLGRSRPAASRPPLICSVRATRITGKPS